MSVRSPLLPALLAFLGFAAAFGYAAGLVPDGAPGMALLSIDAIIRNGWAPLLWFISASGWGAAITRLLRAPRKVGDRGSEEGDAAAPGGGVLSGALGIAWMLALDQVAGTLGWLSGATGAWLLLAPGLILGAVHAATWRPRRGGRSLAAPWWIECWPAAPAVAILLVASTSSPGFLWSTEFGGYDALSYHLQLPKEWLSNGRMAALAHNAYSYLPSWIEGGTLHVFALGGDPVVLGVRAQIFHALMALTALGATGSAGWWIAGRAGGESARRHGAMVAAVIFIGTPWVVVTGSLAYTEMGAALAAAAIALLWMRGAEEKLGGWRSGVAVGLLLALACGSKPSALLVVAIPIVVLVLFGAPLRWRYLTITGAIALITGAVVALPWLLRNGSATGNPLFPYAESIFRSGAWSAEQLEAWRRGHASDLPILSRLEALWNQALRFGIGSNPALGEPWKPFFSVLFPLAIVTSAAMLADRTARRLGGALLVSLLAGLGAWMAFTHLQSRFLVPMTPIAALAVAAGAASLLGAAAKRGLVRRTRVIGAAITVLALAWSLQPLIAFRMEGPAPASLIDAEEVMTGDIAAARLADPRMTPAERQSIPWSRALFVNHSPGSQPVLLIGDAVPFRYRRPVRYSTVWTREPLLAAFERGGAAAEVIADLRRAGVERVLIDRTMLEVWRRSGWLDPSLTSERIEALAAGLKPLGLTSDGAALYAVPAN